MKALQSRYLQATPFLYRGENREIGMHITRINRKCVPRLCFVHRARPVGITALEDAMERACRT